MKNFCSLEQIQSLSNDEVCASIVNLIDSKYITDREKIVSDIKLHESLTGGKCAVFGNADVHTARTQGIREFCMVAAIVENRVEAIILWSDISEHHLGKLAEIVRVLEKLEKSGASSEEIISELKKL